MIEYRTQESTPVEALHFAFVQAFGDYQIRLEMPFEKFRLLIARRGYNPSVSLGAFDGGELVGFTLNALRRWNGRATAYDVCTGVIPDYRKQGITKSIFGLVLDNLRQRQLELYLSEVLQTNTTAFDLYRKQGFEITRRYACFQAARNAIRTSPASGVDIVDQFPLECAGDFVSLWDYDPAWQNSIDSVSAVPRTFACAIVRDRNAIIAYGLIERATGDVPQLAVHPAHRRRGLAASILTALLSCTDSPRIAVVNVDARSECTVRSLQALGFVRFIDQYEMTLAL